MKEFEFHYKCDDYYINMMFLIEFEYFFFLFFIHSSSTTATTNDEKIEKKKKRSIQFGGDRWYLNEFCHIVQRKSQLLTTTAKFH